MLSLDWSTIAGPLEVVAMDGSVSTNLLLLAAVSSLLRELMATVGPEQGLLHLHLPGFSLGTFRHLLQLVTQGVVQVNF